MALLCVITEKSLLSLPSACDGCGEQLLSMLSTVDLAAWLVYLASLVWSSCNCEGTGNV